MARKRKRRNRSGLKLGRKAPNITVTWGPVRVYHVPPADPPTERPARRGNHPL